MKRSTTEIINLERAIQRGVDVRAVAANKWNHQLPPHLTIGFEERSRNNSAPYPSGVFSIDHHGRMAKDPLRNPNNNQTPTVIIPEQILPWLWTGLTCTTTIVAYLLLNGDLSNLPTLFRDYSESRGDDLDQVLSATLWSAAQIFDNNHALLANFVLDLDEWFENLIDEEFMIRNVNSTKRREVPPDTAWRARLFSERNQRNSYVLFVDIGRELVSTSTKNGVTWHDQIRGIAAVMGLENNSAAVTIVRTNFKRSNETKCKSQLTIGGIGNFSNKWYQLTPASEHMMQVYARLMTDLSVHTCPLIDSSRNMLARLKPTKEIPRSLKYDFLECKVLEVLKKNGYNLINDSGDMFGSTSL